LFGELKETNQMQNLEEFTIIEEEEDEEDYSTSEEEPEEYKKRIHDMKTHLIKEISVFVANLNIFKFLERHGRDNQRN
jgi:predicted esterase YcpF (UPF0227 family)